MFNREMRVQFVRPKKNAEAAPTVAEPIVEELNAVSRSPIDVLARYVAVAATAFIALDTYRSIKIAKAETPKFG